MLCMNPRSLMTSFRFHGYQIDDICYISYSFPDYGLMTDGDMTCSLQLYVVAVFLL